MNKWKCAGLQAAEKRREGRVSFLLPEEVDVRTSVYEPGSRFREMAEVLTRNLHHFHCSKVRLGTVTRKIRCQEYSWRNGLPNGRATCKF